METELMDKHWLVFDPKTPGRPITGCHCGFMASEDDRGYGDSVVRHVVSQALLDAADEHPTMWPSMRKWLRDRARTFSGLPPCRLCGEDGGDCAYVCC